VRHVDPKTEIEERARVVRIAKEWEGTPYHTAARKKGIGCDCITFIVEAYIEAGIIDHYDLPHYSSMWHLSHKEELYKNEILKSCRQVETPRAGDIMLVKIGLAFSHGAIVADWPNVYHALMGKRRGVVKASAANDANLIARPREFFSFWE
jgi:cell wall-associated NlpC family hydrolase